MVSGVFIQEVQRECKKAKEKQIFCIVSSPSDSKLELWNFRYVCLCMWPFVDPTHHSKYGARHLHETKNFMFSCRKVTKAVLCVWVVEKNLSRSKRQNHTLYLLKPWWLMREFMIRRRCWSVYQSTNILFLLQCFPVLYLSVGEWHLIQESLGTWWKILWEHEH